MSNEAKSRGLGIQRGKYAIPNDQCFCVLPFSPKLNGHKVQEFCIKGRVYIYIYICWSQTVAVGKSLLLRRRMNEPKQKVKKCHRTGTHVVAMYISALVKLGGDDCILHLTTCQSLVTACIAVCKQTYRPTSQTIGGLLEKSMALVNGIIFI